MRVFLKNEDTDPEALPIEDSTAIVVEDPISHYPAKISMEHKHNHNHSDDMAVVEEAMSGKKRAADGDVRYKKQRPAAVEDVGGQYVDVEVEVASSMVAVEDGLQKKAVAVAVVGSDLDSKQVASVASASASAGAKMASCGDVEDDLKMFSVGHVNPHDDVDRNMSKQQHVTSRNESINTCVMDRKRSAQVNFNSMDAFAKALKKRNLQIQKVDGDGNCLFRAVSIQVYGDSAMHHEVRRRCIDFMTKDADHFSNYIADDEVFSDYLRRKRRDGVHGNNPEIQAISELYNRPVEVYVPPELLKRYADVDPAEDEDALIKPINTFQSGYKTNDIPIRLSYHDGNHYNAIIDPYMPTAGLGLGMPGLKPGLADKMQMQKAIDESDNVHLDYVYQKNAIAMSDVEATDYAIEQAILASSLQEQQINKRDDQERKPSPVNGLENAVSASSNRYESQSQSQDEYPEFVQELVMNGFELQKVMRARDLVGDDFDDLLAFLIQNP